MVFIDKNYESNLVRSMNGLNKAVKNNILIFKNVTNLLSSALICRVRGKALNDDQLVTM
jgi:hypothetical protein